MLKIRGIPGFLDSPTVHGQSIDEIHGSCPFRARSLTNHTRMLESCAVPFGITANPASEYTIRLEFSL